MDNIFLDKNIENLLAREGEVMACSAGVSMYPMLLSRLGLSLGEVVDVLLKNAKKVKYDLRL